VEPNACNARLAAATPAAAKVDTGFLRMNEKFFVVRIMIRISSEGFQTLKVETLKVETLKVATLRVETLRVETLRVENALSALIHFRTTIDTRRRSSVSSVKLVGAVHRMLW
jgi:hypothetical protein